MFKNLNFLSQNIDYLISNTNFGTNFYVASSVSASASGIRLWNADSGCRSRRPKSCGCGSATLLFSPSLFPLFSPFSPPYLTLPKKFPKITGPTRTGTVSPAPGGRGGYFLVYKPREVK
jgi:hypothetical protein